jgi:hypothetical protein
MSTPTEEQLLYTSKPMYVVRQRLSVQIDPHSPGNSQEPYVWYKDEGGRDHGIELLIKLLDEEEQVVIGQEVPLAITLCYHSAAGSSSSSSDQQQVVTKANMLTIITTDTTTTQNSNNAVINTNSSSINGQASHPCCSIDRSLGLVRVKVRINDISKNHQRQCFKLKVSVDLAKSALQYHDIGSAESAAIEVKSKRTKRLRASEHHPSHYSHPNQQHHHHHHVSHGDSSSSSSAIELLAEELEFQNNIKKAKIEAAGE